MKDNKSITTSSIFLAKMIEKLERTQINEYQSNQINTLWWYKKMAHDIQIVRAKENLKLSYGGPSQRSIRHQPKYSRFTPGPSMSLRPDVPSLVYN